MSATAAPTVARRTVGLKERLVAGLLAVTLMATLGFSVWLVARSTDSPSDQAAGVPPAVEPMGVPVVPRAPSMPDTAATGLAGEVGEHGQRLATLEDTIRELQRRLDSESGAASARLEEVAQRLTALERHSAMPGAEASGATVETLRAQIDRVAKRLAGVEWLARQNHQALGADRTRHRAAPPFTVTAIDSWDGRPNVVVRAAGGTRFVAEGGEIEGWRLAAVDTDRRVATFTKNGSRIELGARK